MERRNKSNMKISRYSDYVSGSAARQLAVAEPVRKEIIEKEKKVSRTVQRNRENINKIGVGYFAFLVTATLAVAAVCFIYLNYQAEISAKNKNITALTTQIDTLTAQNDSVDYSINSYMDSANIIKVATEELGMVRASGNQVIYYDSTESEFMKQFADVPKQ